MNSLQAAPNYSIKKWRIWASFETIRRIFCILKVAIWLTVINEILRFPLHLHPSYQINYLYVLSSGYANYSIKRWYFRASFQTFRRRFCKLQVAIWLPVINEIFRFSQHLDPSCQIKYLYGLYSDYPNYSTKNDIFGQVSRLLGKDFINYRKQDGQLPLTKFLNTHYI